MGNERLDKTDLSTIKFIDGSKIPDHQGWSLAFTWRRTRSQSVWRQQKGIGFNWISRCGRKNDQNRCGSNADGEDCIHKMLRVRNKMCSIWLQTLYWRFVSHSKSVKKLNFHLHFADYFNESLRSKHWLVPHSSGIVDKTYPVLFPNVRIRENSSNSNR